MTAANKQRATHYLLIASAILAFTLPAASCGPDFPSAVFVLTNGPGPNYAAFARGRIGIPQPEYRTRHLAIAFDILTQRPLTSTEQQQAIAVNQYFTNPWANDPDENPDLKKTLPPTGFDSWIAARKTFGPVDNYTPPDDLETSYSRQSYESYANCLDDSFATATRTLAARIATHGSKDPSVIEWVRGQDAVYSNCSDGKPKPHYGSDPIPPTPLQPHLPAAVSNAPRWLQQDRAYQLAAANLYANNLDPTLAGFRSIAADTASPWSILSRYLVARTLLRQATIAYNSFDRIDPQTGKTSDARDYFLTTLAAAQKELLAMRSEPRMATLSGPIDDLLDFVDLRLQPSAQAAILADRLHGPNPRRFGQSLIDLTFLRANPNEYGFDSETVKPPPPHGPEQDTAGMLDWLDTINRADEPAALTHWHTTHSTVWLLAAIAFAQPSDPATPDLIKVAEAIPSSDPAFIAINYHRLRLTPRSQDTRSQLLALLPTLQTTQSTSTINLFTTLTAATAPTLDTWLVTAPRSPAAEASWSTTDDAFVPPPENVCGAKVPPNTLKLFDVDAAYTLNHQLPLRLLATAAESPTLPANLRYQVAQAAWARAVLLDQPEIARRMSPILTACRPAWQPVLTAYDAATTPLDRHATALLALMRFASTEPSVREGEERRNGFATYDEFRQNWWCTTIPDPGSDVDFDPYPNPPNDVPRQHTPTTPRFLTPSDLAESTTQVAQLQMIPNASTYFALQALAFFKAHPTDPRTPDILGEADRVLRNSCRNDYLSHDDGKPNPNPNATANLAHQVFLALQHYPQSPWTKHYKSWE
jgi:hypothetical protein